MIKYNHKTFKYLAQVVRYRESLEIKAQLLFDLIEKEPYSNQVINRRIQYQGLQEDINKFDKWLETKEV